MVGRAFRRSQIVAVGDSSGSVLQTYGVHGADVGVGTLLQAVLKHRYAAVAPAPETGHVGTVAANAVDGAGKDALFDGSGRCHAVTDKAACIVAADVEHGRDGALIYRILTIGKANEACRVATVGGNGTGDGHVLDGGILDVAERSKALGISVVVAEVCRQRLAITEEDAAEGLVLALAHRRAYDNVVSQTHILAAVVCAA